MADHEQPRLIVGIDPGDVQSALTVYDTVTQQQLFTYIRPNQEILDCLLDHEFPLRDIDELNDEAINLTGAQPDSVQFVIEMIASYGMPVGKTVFDTVLWIGRFLQAIDENGGRSSWRLITRGAVKLHLCHSSRAKDSNVTAAICNRYGGDVKRAKGTKKKPGPLYGFAGDMWAALGVAITAAETAETYYPNA